MILTPEYLKELPPWMQRHLAEKQATEVYDHDHDWNTPWDQTPDIRIWKPYGDALPFLLEVNEQGTLDITGIVDGKLYTFYGCYPVAMTTTRPNDDTTPEHQTVTEVEMPTYPPLKGYKFRVEVNTDEMFSLFNKKDPNRQKRTKKTNAPRS